MITRYITSVSTVFSPFNARSGKTARTFLALLPPNARSSGVKINVKMLSQAEASQPGKLELMFKDGKAMNIDIESLKIMDIQREVDRHSRMLQRQDDLNG